MDEVSLRFANVSMATHLCTTVHLHDIRPNIDLLPSQDHVSRDDDL